MNNKQYVGKRVSSFERLNDIGPITGIALVVDEENEYQAGDQTGYVLEVECPYGTQTMANDLLASLAGNTYKGFRAGDAELDMSAELGDGVTVNGIYTMLAYRNLTFGPGHMSEISAPSGGELEHEYPYISSTQREINRRIAQTRSYIEKTSESISLRIEGLEGNISKIDQRVDSITLSVSSENGSTTFTLEADGATLSTKTLDLSVDAVNISGTLTASQIDATNLKVSAANVTGSLTIGQLPSSVATSDEIPYYTSDLYNDAGFQDETGVTTIIDGTITTDYINALGISAQYLKGRTVYLLDRYEVDAGAISIGDADTASSAIYIDSYGALGLSAESGDIYIEANTAYGSFGSTVIHLQDSYIAVTCDAFLSGYAPDLGLTGSPWNDVYANNTTIQTSDRTKKHDIVYGLDAYDALFDALRPVSFLFNDGTSGRRHLGVISQDVENALTELGISTADFAAFIKSTKLDDDYNPIEGEYDYAFRYGEIIPLNTWQIQQLKARMAKLEAAVYG